MSMLEVVVCWVCVEVGVEVEVEVEVVVEWVTRSREV